MIWRLVLHRLILWIIAIVVLIPAVAWKTFRNLNRLPWGLDPIFGCEEDGGGNGEDPANERQGWEEGIWGKWIELKDRMPGRKYQGWWPDYKRVKWSELNGLQRWWYQYRWYLRNLCWNLRKEYNDWFSISIHYNDIGLTYADVDLESGKKTYEWIDKMTGDSHWYRERPLFGRLLCFGWEFYPYVFDQKDPLYSRVRDIGYTREYKYKHRSVPSIRLKKK